MPNTVPHDENAERSVIGCCLLDRKTIEIALEIIDPSYFYKPIYGHLFEAIEYLYKCGEVIDAVTVASRIKQLGFDFQPSDLIGITAEVPTIHGVRDYCKAVEHAKISRDIMRAAQDALGQITDGADPYDVSDELTRTMLTVGTKDVVQKAMTLSELAASEDAISPIVIPGLLKQEHRMIVTARPGAGKSTYLKFLGLCASQGIQPFTHQAMDPIRVLCVDTENPVESILQSTDILSRTLAQRKGGEFNDERFKIYRRPGGMNIRVRRDRTEFQREIALHQPDLVVAGPVYKLTRKLSGRENYEDAAYGFIEILDDLRTKYGFALCLEAHPPKDKEEWSPAGSAVLSQWPEIGFGMKKDDQTHALELEYFREERLQGLRWPTRMERDPQWLFRAVFGG